MLIAQDKVVLIHYTLTDDAGKVLDSSSGGEPLAYLHGQGNIIAGLETALSGKQAGDRLNVRVEPVDGYGVRDDALTSQGHARVVTVTRVVGDMVTVDGNHPLAGEVLNFDVEVKEVRDATHEELEHGHVHGPGGHHHHG
jgi:FKBP-type peptidyl-prolyl cis-trans isomerase SlyD